MGKLTPNQKIFVSEYIKDRNATRAYGTAYPNASHRTAIQEGYRMLKEKAHVKAAVDKALKKIVRKNELTAERVLLEDQSIAFSDLTVMFPDFVFPEALKPAIRSIKITETEVSGTKTKKVVISTWDKSRSLDRLGKYLGIYKDSLEVEGLENLGDKLAKAQERIKKGGS